jgi:hypothetical protein
MPLYNFFTNTGIALHGQRTEGMHVDLIESSISVGRMSVFIYSSGDSPAVATWLVATVMIVEGSAMSARLATK